MDERCIDGLWKPKEKGELEEWFKKHMDVPRVKYDRRGWSYGGIAMGELLFMRVAIEEGTFTCTRKGQEQEYCVRDMMGRCYTYHILDELMERIKEETHD
jgi:hypothetical protein